MPKTAVSLFRNREAAEEVVRDIESIGFPRNEVRTLGEPLDFGVTGVTSIPEIDFEVELFRELTRIGATKQDVEAYVDGVRRGGVLVLATGSDEKVDRAAEIMNRHGAADTEEISGPEPHLPSLARGSEAPTRGSQVQTGRVREPGAGATFFVW
jgi:acylphosphatase